MWMTQTFTQEIILLSLSTFFFFFILSAANMENLKNIKNDLFLALFCDYVKVIYFYFKLDREPS